MLVLVHSDCVPPKDATVVSADWAHWKTEFYVLKALKNLGHEARVLPVSDNLSELQETLLQYKPHIAFNLLEEFQGEPRFESHVVALLELLGVPYTGCNPEGLALGRDKATSKKILQYHGIPTPGFFTVALKQKIKVPTGLNFPMIVKALNEEASLGISQQSVVYDFKSLKERVDFIHAHLQTTALVEEYIDGREFYVGVLGNKQLKVFSPWELQFGDLAKQGHAIATRNVKFNKKYSDRHGIKRGAAQDLSAMVIKKIENLSRSAYKALKLSGYARLDFRLTPQGELFFLEANPNAELANKECLANAAHHSGVPYEQLISKILSLGLSYPKAA